MSTVQVTEGVPRIIRAIAAEQRPREWPQDTPGSIERQMATNRAFRRLEMATHELRALLQYDPPPADWVAAVEADVRFWLVKSADALTAEFPGAFPGVREGDHTDPAPPVPGDAACNVGEIEGEGGGERWRTDRA